ncbi:hypothetical protein FHL15_010737 [Xylaria flabelliformis]|uniref:DUF3533 domain-containing protein n=1 Tax=Xylaria flabelliformis TaxID=2512241 RepID=A0A553HK85_9PEZI|nr:hypothetical protein FHL15_010737 [Xylaria flabelliformis]
MVLGQPWAALWLIFWVITAFNTLELAPPFYAWGRAYGVLFAWTIANTAPFPLCLLLLALAHRTRAEGSLEGERLVCCAPPPGDHEFMKKEGDEPPKTRRGFMRNIEELRAIDDTSLIFEDHILAAIYEDDLGTVTEVWTGVR